MAGHSHSANIKFRKDRVDAVRARLFAKLARNITVAARMGGGDPAANPRLRLAVEKARVASMPKDNIERAIKKGTGEGGDGAAYEELVYEGYGPGGVAVLVDILTDNRNRTAPEVRKIFERHGGSLGTTGSVAFQFERKAVFAVAGEVGEERLLELVLEAGGDDLEKTDDGFEVTGPPSSFLTLKEALEGAGLSLGGGEVMAVPSTRVELADEDLARKVLKMLDALDEHDDVQAVSANHAVSDQLAARLGAAP